MKKEKLLVIVGPTAVGKTELSVSLAEKYSGEIISGDSLQVYKKLDIGTAKVTEEEKRGVPHYLIDVKEAADAYSAYEFKQSAEAAISEISQRNHLAIVAGGTGMYIQSLLFDFNLGAPKEKDQENQRREYWENYAKENGREKLWEFLNSIDSKAADSIHLNNQKRIIRAIEVFEKTGVSILEQQEMDIKDLSNSPYDVKLIGLETDRELLYERINLRVDIMMKEGLLKEAEYVYSLGEVQSRQGIGYKEFFPYFRGEMDLETCIEKVKQNSRQYAKRQLTWFKNRMTVEWFDLVQHEEELKKIQDSIENWLAE